MKIFESETYHYYNANPKNRKGSDCVARALCTAMNMKWETVIREMTEVGITKGYEATDTKTIAEYLKLKEWEKQLQPRKGDNTKYTGAEFCKKLRAEGNTKPIIANIGGHHMVAIINNKINDIWNCSHKCIGNYWIQY